MSNINHLDNIDNSPLMVINRAIQLQGDCYYLLEYLMVSKTICKSHHFNGRLTNFIQCLRFLLEMLNDKFSVQEMCKINMGELAKLVDLIKKQVGKLKCFGLKLY